ncbi:SDR family NAD(P)-dependent oxidoreductase [Pontibacter beigongshangensis]|uniref:SDR family NAD(P)-dependent oxidoreductase n=1 Tax=Pontibacter beigongshangensis TaxID=2574733 RepID=UPI00164FE5AA|nr:SDR family oxidoreductase [Pontibacter beigongshangensis]
MRNKVAIVTGAGQGIGLQICRQLANAGANVLLNDLQSGLAESASRLIRKENGSCMPLAGDASDTMFIEQLIETAVSEFGSVDIIVANAGITLFGDFLNYTPEAFSKVMQVNLGATFFLAQAAARQMIRQASGGSLLFMSSVTGHQAHKNLAAYSMSKAAIEMLAKNLVIELSPYKINVNTLAPGATLTERTMQEPGYEATWSAITPMGRPAAVTDIARAALFLVSEEARHITGQSLVIDGGWTCISPSPF